MAGTLYLCATPIGNLEDITLRVLRVLSEADLIAAEDTRHTAKLLNYYEITTPQTSYHEHNKDAKAPKLIAKLLEGADIALVTDAGMPGVSDPGADLVKLCFERGISVTVCPGACAAVTALVLSGQDTEKFVFEGFLPTDKRKRRERVENLLNETRTVILYEAPHRILDTLTELRESLGERSISVLRELTKIHEENFMGTISAAIERINQTGAQGEYVMVLAGGSERGEAVQTEWADMTVSEHVAMYEKLGQSRMDAIKAAARDRRVGKREIYEQLINEQEE